MTAIPRTGTARMPLVVMVDDEPDNLAAFAFNFSDDFRIETAASVAAAWELLGRGDEVAVVIADQKMPDQTGLDLLAEVKDRFPHAYRILLTAYTEPEILIAAINRGVLHRFIAKPWEYGHFKQDILNGIESYRLSRDNAKLRHELCQAAKLAAIGELSASIAHDLAQPLTAMRGYLCFLEDIARTKEIDEAALEDTLAIFRKGTETMDRLVTHLRDYARRTEPAFVATRPEQAIDGAILLVRDSFLRQGVELERAVEAPLPKVLADPQQLEQILMNLLLNARDACAGKPLRRVRVSARTTPDGAALVLRVADTGGGVPPEIAGRIFEPFFTTKPAGKGTGLGLSIVKTIVTNHGGTIEVENREGGAVFEVRLPLTGPVASEGIRPGGGVTAVQSCP